MAQEQLVAALASQSFDLVAVLLDQLFREAQRSHLAVTDNWPFALHLACLAFARRWEEARALWKHVPGAQKQHDAELQAVWRVLTCLWQREFSAVWPALQGVQWSAQLQPVMAALADKLRLELLEMLSVAYRSVKPSKVAAICGMSEQEARTACLAAGWEWNEASGTLTVAKAAPVMQQCAA